MEKLSMHTLLYLLILASIQSEGRGRAHDSALADAIIPVHAYFVPVLALSNKETI